MSENKSFAHEQESESMHLSAEGSLSAMPPAFQLQSAAAPIQCAGHTPGQDHSSGTLREMSYLRQADLRTRQTDSGQNIYFREGDNVTMVAEAANNFQWIEVSGTAYRGRGTAAASVGQQTGFIQRAWTDMTVGVYDGLNVDDQTDTYGSLGTNVEVQADEIILHQTFSPTGASTLRTYDRRVTRNEHVGAQYLIDENGAIILVVPANERVYHVRGNKRKPLTRPAAAPGQPAFTQQMATVRQEIEDYYTELTTLSIPADQQQALLAMNDTDLHALLQAQRWEIYSQVSNSDAVGIEVVGMPEQLYQNSPGFTPANMTAIRATVQGYDLSPELKEQLLKTEERAGIQADQSLSTADREAQLTTLDRELYSILRTNNWYIYVDLSAEQKYASWMLVQKLCQEHGLDVHQDALGHNQTDAKTLGEGENNQEFIRTMAEFQDQIAGLNTLVTRYGITLEGELAFLEEFRTAVTSMQSGQMLQPGEDGYDDMIAFLQDFYQNNQQLISVMGTLTQANGLPVQDLLTRYAAATGDTTEERLTRSLVGAVLGGILLQVNVTVNNVAGPIDSFMENPDSVTVQVSGSGGNHQTPVASLGNGGQHSFEIPMAGLLPFAAGEALNIQVMDSTDLICNTQWIPIEGAATDFSQSHTIANYSASVSLNR